MLWCNELHQVHFVDCGGPDGSGERGLGLPGSPLVADALTVAGHREVGGARLVASELVGNAVLHTGSGRPGGLVRVKVFEVSAATARVEVIDEGAATVPLPRRSDDDD